MTETPVPWELLASRVVYEGYTTVRRDTYRLPDGSVSDWDVLEQRDTVAVVAVTESGEALLFTQFRVGPRAAIGELPGGLIDDGEDPLAAAARELLEETGYAAAALFLAGGEWSGANSTRRKNVVIAAGCRRVADPRWEAGETGVVALVTLPDLVDHLLAGALSDAGEAMRGLHVFLRADPDDALLRALQGRVAEVLHPQAMPVAGPGGASSRCPIDMHPGAEDADPVDAFWDDVDLEDAEAARAALDALLAATGATPARAAYERASLRDARGEETEAIPLYRVALESGLDPRRRSEATIQLASSLRNVGDASGAMALLRGVPDSDPLADAARAFLALALHSDDKPVAALRTALGALIPHLPQYHRSLRAYTDELAPLRRVRAISVALLVRGGKVLLERYPATDFHGAFLRAPGGGIEFGERADAAVRREIAEELGARVETATPMGVTENIFDASDRAGHEIVHVFAIRSPELESLGPDARLPVRDSHTTVGWVDVAALRDGTLPVYPVGIREMIEAIDGDGDGV